MHNYSRNMPPVPKPPRTLVGYVVLATLAAALVFLVYQFTVYCAAIAAGYAIVCVVATINTNRRCKKLAAERAGESSCTFARSFDYRNMDTWIIRAVYEALQPWCACGSPAYPLRATDRLLEDLGIDVDDLDEICNDIAFRTSRSYAGDDCKKNPLYGKVRTVRDLVMVFHHQPKLNATEKPIYS